MKRYIILVIVFSLLTGCQSLDDQESIDLKTFGGNKIVPYTDEVLIIGLISKYEGDPFLDAVMDTAESILYEKGYHVVRKSPYSYTNTINEQNRILEEFILSGVDGIIIIPNDDIQLNDAIREALNHDIPVIIVDTPIDSVDLLSSNVNDKLLSFIQISNYVAAYDSATLYFDSIDDVYKSAIISGDLNNPNASERRDGIIQAIEEHKNIELIDTIDGGWQESEAYSITYNLMQDDSEINMIICSNDRMAIGTVFALKEMKLLDNVIVTGFDGIDDAKSAVDIGEIAYTVCQEPSEFGIKAVDALIEIIDVGYTKKYHYIDTELYMEGNN